MVDAFAYTLLAFVSVLVATSLFFVRYSTGASPSKSRLSRARRAASVDSKALDDMPSIVRERTVFLKRLKSGTAHTGITVYLSRLEALLDSSGTGLKILHFFLLFSILSTSAAAAFFVIFEINLLLAFLFSFLFSSFASIQFLIHRRRRQIRRFQEIFPDALDLIVRSVRAGLPVSEAIKVISAEVAAPVSTAFREIASNLSIGISLDEALSTLQRKVPIAEVKFFAISLTIQQETGGNIAEILSNLARMMRKRVQIGKKIRALSSEARASAYIIGSLPFLVGFAIYLLNREYIEVLFFDPSGQLLLLGALSSIFVGGMVIAKLIRFEI